MTSGRRGYNDAMVPVKTQVRHCDRTAPSLPKEIHKKGLTSPYLREGSNPCPHLAPAPGCLGALIPLSYGGISC